MEPAVSPGMDDSWSVMTELVGSYGWLNGKFYGDNSDWPLDLGVSYFYEQNLSKSLVLSKSYSLTHIYIPKPSQKHAIPMTWATLHCNGPWLPPPVSTSSEVDHQRLAALAVHQDVLNGVHDHHVVPLRGRRSERLALSKCHKNWPCLFARNKQDPNFWPCQDGLHPYTILRSNSFLKSNCWTGPQKITCSSINHLLQLQQPPRRHRPPDHRHHHPNDLFGLVQNTSDGASPMCSWDGSY